METNRKRPQPFSGQSQLAELSALHPTWVPQNSTCPHDLWAYCYLVVTGSACYSAPNSQKNEGLAVGLFIARVVIVLVLGVAY